MIAAETVDNNAENFGGDEEKNGAGRLLDEKLVELQSLFELSQTLNSSLNLKSILDNMLLTPMGKMMLSRGIVLLHQSGEQFRVETLKGLARELIGQVIEISPIISTPVSIEQFQRAQAKGIEFFIANHIAFLLPIRSSDKTLGLIGFGKKISGRPFSPSELDFLQSLSNIAATAIENGLMVMKLQEVNRRLDKKIQELNTLFDISKELNSTLDADKILNLLSFVVMGEMLVNRCLIYLRLNEDLELVMSKGHRTDEELQPFREASVLQALRQITQPMDLASHSDLAPELSVFVQAGYRVIVPMRIQNQTRGLLTVGERITRTAFQDYDLEFLSTLGNEAMICLENARLFKETLEKQRLEEELAIAREIQQKLLPQECPRLDGYEIAAINVPSRQVSGDYFDCVKLSPHKICLAIADVSGKGTGASLLMANLQATLQALMEANSSLTDIAAKINNLIYRNTSYDKFITFFFGVLDLQQNSFSYVNAGHNPPLHLKADGSVQVLEQGGLILGMMPNMPYQQATISLQPGDWIIMYTDGVTEAVNNADEEFEEQRLLAVARNNLQATADQMQERILQAVQQFAEDQPQHDDITLLILKAKSSIA
ncbi:MAG: SpoIIE family protein phosphatase [candidate division KSB1 bacterium]|nr:SpoIIE family protein phosphatase [candidate division KSB1 bacterium]